VAAQCFLPTLQTFLNESSVTQSLEISSQHLSTNPDQPDEVLIGSYILFKCKTGYTNTDNHLNVTCNPDGQWSPSPNCISSNTDDFSRII
jgi:hypothetical protein